MPLSKKELDEIEESHRSRPYLVVYKDKMNIYAYPSSSTNTGDINSYTKYHIDGSIYGNRKDSWFDLRKTYKVPVYNLKSSFYNLNIEDMIGIQRRLEVIKEKSSKEIYNLLDNYEITKGDIVWAKGNINYVYKCDKKYIYCYKLYRSSRYKKILAPILIRNKKYYIDLDDEVKYKRTNEFGIRDFASNMEVNYIDNEIINRKKTKEKYVLDNEIKKITSKYKMGTLFQIRGNKIAYLFTADDKDYGVNIATYTSNPSLYWIQDYRRRNIIGDIPLSKCLDILEKLYVKKVKPQKNIEELYQKLKYRLR